MTVMSHIIKHNLACDYRDFLDIEMTYTEPQMARGSVRIFIYISHQLTIYAGNPFALCISDHHEVPSPMLDGSM